LTKGSGYSDKAGLNFREFLGLLAQLIASKCSKYSEQQSTSANIRTTNYPMAIKATIFKVALQIADLDRHYYVKRPLLCWAFCFAGIKLLAFSEGKLYSQWRN
jgi:hypothetical protein